MTARTQLVLFHTMDPRGSKLGGIETHVRLVLERHPAAMSILFVGIDEIGDLVPGRVVPLEVGCRDVAFLPVVHVPAAAINRAATALRRSTTLRYALGLLRHLPAIRRATRHVPACCEIERFEFALVPKLLRLPLVMLVHNEGSRQDKMDSLIKKYWAVHRINEWLAMRLADRVFAVNPAIAERVAALSRSFAVKTEVLSVSVDTQRFAPSPFDRQGETFRVCFAGRLDAFKDPPLMFATLATLAAKLEARRQGKFRRLAFDYVGASDPMREPAFAEISDFAVCHGIRAAPEVATIMRQAHAGIITSFFEGMPCYLLEMLASGRPLAAITLPQFAPLILAGVSGALVERRRTLEDSAAALADALLTLVEQIERGAFDPAAIAALAAPFSVEAQMHRLFSCHEALAGRGRAAYRKESMRSA